MTAPMRPRRPSRRPNHNQLNSLPWFSDARSWASRRWASVAYHCEVCDAAIGEHHKTAMLAGGEWRATATSQDPHTVGFHISALYSPVGWLSWEQIARDWEAAQGKPEDLKTFRNTVLGEVWQEHGEAPDWERLVERREDFALGVVPPGALVLTAGVDVQDDRIEVDVWGWAEGCTSWLIDHVVIPGSPRERAPWDELAKLLARDWPRGTTRRDAHRQGVCRHRRPGHGLGLWPPAASAGSAHRADQGRGGLEPGTAGAGADAGRCPGQRPEAAPRSEAVDGLGLDLEGGPVSPALAGPRRGRRLSPGLGASAPRHRSRVGQAAGRRAVAHDEGPARLCPAGMGQAPGAERGTGLRGAGARRAVAARCRSLRRPVLAAAARGTGGCADCHRSHTCRERGASSPGTRDTPRRPPLASSNSRRCGLGPGSVLGLAGYAEELPP